MTTTAHPPADRWCRAGVLTPRGRVDLALPADVPVAELVPMVLELIGEPSRQDESGGSPVPEPWRLCGPAGGPLPPEATLDGLGVLDGELLHIGPRAAAVPPPVFDDPADALAAAVRDGGSAGSWRPGPVAAPLVVTAAAVLLATVRTSSVPVVVAAAVVAVLGAGLAVLHARRVSSRDGAAAGSAALCATAPAAAAGVLVLPGPLGSGQVLLGALGAGLAAVLGLAVLRSVTPALLAVVVVAPALVVAAVVRLGTDAPIGAIGAGLAAVALAAGPVLPRAALRVAGMPAPVVPTDLEEIARADTAVLPAPELGRRADLARGLFAGLSAGAALPAGGGAVVAAADGSWSGVALAAVTVVVLLLRARAFAEAGPALVLAATAVGTAVGTGLLAATAHGPVVRLVAAGVLGLGVLVAVRTAGTTLSPVGRRTLDVLELVLTAAAIPAALAAMGLFALVRGL
ncbi:type VII secretion integral membrane protein EccD [Pseudonocardia endophytica]|uniref:Type VII secretion integral membrane protein EccD n=1 Tax=Pseudonocardia endophytica TaxID=401976 RepID=A0A4V2PHE0_PSEEN|nr:type VII secretion integral membrane protein EccD [Pseudonocardia endophytica]TCK20366.1 type VII secretion integral membrane protein EccD [Pseudonocardia endophytica]